MLATQPASSLFHPPQALRLDDAWRPLAEAMHEFEERALQLQARQGEAVGKWKAAVQWEAGHSGRQHRYSLGWLVNSMPAHPSAMQDVLRDAGASSPLAELQLDFNGYLQRRRQERQRQEAQQQQRQQQQPAARVSRQSGAS